MEIWIYDKGRQEFAMVSIIGRCEMWDCWVWRLEGLQNKWILATNENKFYDWKNFCIEIKDCLAGEVRLWGVREADNSLYVPPTRKHSADILRIVLYGHYLQ